MKAMQRSKRLNRLSNPSFVQIARLVETNLVPVAQARSTSSATGSCNKFLEAFRFDYRNAVGRDSPLSEG